MNSSYPNPASGVGSGGQPQQPVFGAGNMQAPISSGTGDIMLAPEKKSHKGVIIALVLAVLIIGGLFAVMFLMPRGNSGINGDAKLAFNRYANYLLYGKESDAEIVANNSSGSGSVENDTNDEATDNYGSELNMMLVDDDKEHVLEYTNKLEFLWRTFSNLTDNFVFADNITKNEYGNRLSFIIEYLKNRDAISDEVVKKLVIDGVENVNNKIDNYLEPFSAFDFDEARNYVENCKKYYSGLGEIIRKMNNEGCFGENALCPVEIVNNATTELLVVDEYRSNMNNILDQTVVYLAKQCLEMDKFLKGYGS